MARAAKNRLALRRVDLSCPHCGARLTDPVVPQPTETERLQSLIENLRSFQEAERHQARHTEPVDRTFSQWCEVVGFPNDVKGADLVEHLTRLRDEVAANVG